MDLIEANAFHLEKNLMRIRFKKQPHQECMYTGDYLRTLHKWVNKICILLCWKDK